MKDQIIKFLAYDEKISITCISTTNLVEEARRIHDLSPLATAVMGSILTITALIGADMKNETDKLTIQIKGSGTIGTTTFRIFSFETLKRVTPLAVFTICFLKLSDRNKYFENSG